VPWSPSTDDLLDLNVPRRVDSFRFDLLEGGGTGNTVIGQVHPVGDSPVRITNDMSRTIPRTLDGLYLPASEQQAINTLRNRVKPVAILQNGVEFVLGEFLWADDSRPRRAWGLERKSTLVDRMFTVDQDLGGTFGWGPGTLVRTILEYLLYGLFEQAELDLPGLDTITIGAPVAWSGSVKRTEVAIDLAQLTGYFPPYISKLGFFTMRPVPDLDGITPDLAYPEGGRIWNDSIVEADDSLTAPNRYIVTEQSGGTAPITAVYDLPATAPHAIANRGFPVVRTITMSGLQSPAAAFAAAKAAAMSDLNSYEWRTWSSTLDFRHDTWDPLSFLDEGVWLETASTMQLVSGGEMTHVARRQYQ
jgi:hypothetical protein